VTGHADAALALLARHYGRPEGVLTASGAASVEVALRWLGVSPGDEVIVPDTGCYKIAAAVVRGGALPVFASVGRAVVLDPASVGAALGPRTRCVVAVHQYGLPCPVGAIRAALPDGIWIVEDAAQAWGTVGSGGPAGRDGDLVVTSFGPRKPVSVGAGGAMLGDDPGITGLVGSDAPGHRLLAVPPTPAPFPAPLLGELVRRLDRADALTACRREFVTLLEPLFECVEFRLPDLRSGDRPSWHRLPVWCATAHDRNRLMAAADRVGLRARPEQDVPLAKLPMFRYRHRAAAAPTVEAESPDDRAYLVVLSTDGRQRQARGLVSMLAGDRSPVRRRSMSMTTEPVNPHVFGAATASDRVRDNVLRVLADREMFRYRADGARSWNDRLEKSLGAWTGCAGAVAANSGTSGLRAALRAAGVVPGDHVLVSAYTFVATAMAVAAIGAVPVPMDLSPELGVDADDLAVRLHPGVRAVIAVHVLGHLADLGPVCELLVGRDIALIEDACQAFGATTGGRPAGSVGDLGVFSFHQAKQLAAGEGGAIVSRAPDLVAACARQVDMGAVRDDAGLPNWDDEHAVLGEGCRMTELQAAVLCAQLDELPAVLHRQRAVRSRLCTLLAARGVRTVRSADPDGDSASHLILLADAPEHARAIVARAREGGVLVRPVWDRPYYRHGVFERAGLTPEKLGVARAVRAENLAPRLLSVPISPGVDASTADGMADVISAAVSGRRGGAG